MDVVRETRNVYMLAIVEAWLFFPVLLFEGIYSLGVDGGSLSSFFYLALFPAILHFANALKRDFSAREDLPAIRRDTAIGLVLSVVCSIFCAATCAANQDFFWIQTGILGKFVYLMQPAILLFRVLCLWMLSAI